MVPEKTLKEAVYEYVVLKTRARQKTFRARDFLRAFPEERRVCARLHGAGAQETGCRRAAAGLPRALRRGAPCEPEPEPPATRRHPQRGDARPSERGWPGPMWRAHRSARARAPRRCWPRCAARHAASAWRDPGVTRAPARWVGAWLAARWASSVAAGGELVVGAVAAGGSPGVPSVAAAPRTPMGGNGEHCQARGKPRGRVSGALDFCPEHSARGRGARPQGALVSCRCASFRHRLGDRLGDLAQGSPGTGGAGDPVRAPAGLPAVPLAWMQGPGSSVSAWPGVVKFGRKM